MLRLRCAAPRLAAARSLSCTVSSRALPRASADNASRRLRWVRSLPLPPPPPPLSRASSSSARAPTFPGPSTQSQEDRELKERLELAVERLGEDGADVEIVRMALEVLRKEIREATTSMTAVPKPLKFLLPHWEPLKALFLSPRFSPAGASSSAPASASSLSSFSSSTLSSSSSASSSSAMQVEGSNAAAALEPATTASNRRLFADVLAVLATTAGAEGQRECLRLKLQGNADEVGEWGHQFVGFLAGEVGAEYPTRQEAAAAAAAGSAAAAEAARALGELDALVARIVPFNMAHNAEPEAVDLLLEIGQLPRLLALGVDQGSHARVSRLAKRGAGSHAHAHTRARACARSAPTTSQPLTSPHPTPPLLYRRSARLCLLLCRCART